MVMSIPRPEACPAELIPDAHRAFRADVLELIGRVGLAPDEAVTLVETSSGHPFDACTPAELVPFLSELLTLAQQITRTTAGRACSA